jgi:hypothetical protein
MTSTPSEANAQLNDLASSRMESGIALLNRGTPEDLNQAIRFFDEAIELRRGLPLEENPGFRYSLAAGWINRGDAFARLGGGANLVEAVNSYSAAIDLLKEPPAGDDGSFLGRLAIAWTNRGVALEHQEGEPALAEAILSYRKVIELLTGGQSVLAPRLQPILAAALVNLGNASLRAPGRASAMQACDAEEKALTLLAANESNSPPEGEAALRARYILCHAITILLGETSDDPSSQLDLVGKMTDAIESGLSLARSWEKAGVTRFRPLATQFFQLGAWAYERYQPHFLAQFLLDHLDPEAAASDLSPDADWLTIAEESLSRSRRALSNLDFASLMTPEGIRRMEILKEVRAAEERIRIISGGGGLYAKP